MVQGYSFTLLRICEASGWSSSTLEKCTILGHIGAKIRLQSGKILGNNELSPGRPPGFILPCLYDVTCMLFFCVELIFMAIPCCRRKYSSQCSSEETSWNLLTFLETSTKRRTGKSNNAKQTIGFATSIYPGSRNISALSKCCLVCRVHESIIA